MTLQGATTSPTQESKHAIEHEYVRLMHLYNLGYYLLDTTFRNAVVSAVITFMSQGCRQFPGATSIQAIWEITPAECPMQRIIVRKWATCTTLVDRHWEEVPHSFAVRAIKEMAQLRDGKVKVSHPTIENICEYHEHDEKTPKCV